MAGQFLADPLGRALFEGNACSYCGMSHKTVCPRVTRVEFDAVGGVTAVEMHHQQPFTVERSDGDTDECVSGSYEDVRRYQRERKMQ